MGSSESTMTQVNKVIEETSMTQQTDCSSTSSDVMGNFNLTCGPGCCNCMDFNVTQVAKASCDVSADAAIDQLAKMADQIKNSATASLSFSRATSNTKQINETNVKQALTENCGSSSHANASMKDINITFSGDCKGMSSTELAAQCRTRFDFVQSTSSQARCLLHLATKMAAEQDSQGSGKSDSTDPFNRALSNLEGSLQNIFGDLTQYIPYIAGILVVGLVLMLILKGAGRHRSHYYGPPEEE